MNGPAPPHGEKGGKPRVSVISELLPKHGREFAGKQTLHGRGIAQPFEEMELINTPIAGKALAAQMTCNQPDNLFMEEDFMTKLKLILQTAVAASCFFVIPSLASARDSGTVTETIEGTASWYGPGFHGRKTANGETFDMNDFTAAHPSLPFGTQVRVTNEATAESVVVRINDRGPFAKNRAIDLSREAAADIGLLDSGVASVTIEVLA